jgi:hypothetical protein
VVFQPVYLGTTVCSSATPGGQRPPARHGVGPVSWTLDMLSDPVVCGTPFVAASKPSAVIRPIGHAHPFR